MSIDAVQASELEALQALVDSDGWKLFASMVGKQWGDSEGNGERFLQAVSNASKASDADAIAQLRQIVVAQREMQLVMRWPADRLKQLQQASQGPGQAHPSRRGSL